VKLGAPRQGPVPRTDERRRDRLPPLPHDSLAVQRKRHFIPKRTGALNRTSHAEWYVSRIIRASGDRRPLTIGGEVARL
jgi:hypothetical protein